MVDVLEALAWMERARFTARGEVAVHDDVMYCQNTSLLHNPCCLMSMWSKPCL